MALEVCRICGGNTELKNILDQGPEIIEKLLKCANVQVFREDSLPHFICQQCNQNLDLSYNLRKQSAETARVLRMQLKNNEPAVAEEPARDSKVEAATSSKFCMEDIKLSQQCASVPSSSNSAYNDEIIPIHLPLKIEPSDIDEEEFQMIDNSNPVLENEFNDAYEVYGSLEAPPLLIDDIKIEEVKLIPPDEISMVDNEGNDTAESQNYLQMQLNDIKDMVIEGDNKAYLNSNDVTSPYEESTLFVDKGVDISPLSKFATEDCEDLNLSSSSKSTGHLSQFTCPTCSNVLYSQKDYDKHLQEHEKTQTKGTLDNLVEVAHSISNVLKKCTCNICKQKFTQLDDLKHHMKSHSDEYGYTCTICFHSYKKNVYLKNHVNSAHPWKFGVSIPKYNQCNYCGERLRTSFTYQKHIHSMHPNEKPPYKCKTCSKEYFQLKTLTRHERLQHSGNDKFHKCDICLKSFKQLSHLTRHKSMHSAPQHSCSICSAKFRYNNYLNVHMRLHQKNPIEKSLKCVICSEEFSHPDLLKNHTKRKHSDNTSASENINPLEKNESELINKDDRFEVVKHTGDDHEKYTSNSNENILWDSQKNSPKMGDHQCGYCGKQFEKSQAYKVHLYVHTKNKISWTHGVNVPKKNQCGYCGKQFKSSSIYHMHLRNFHSNIELPHKCKSCNKRYFSLRSLSRHEKQEHSGNNRPYKCDICLKRFYRWQLLKLHKLIHSAPQHLCSMCPVKFRHQSTLDAHMRKHTNVTIESYKCDICFRQFSHLNSLKRHTKIIHSITTTSGNINPESITQEKWTPGVSIPKKHQCDYCGKQLTTHGNYQRHILNLHPSVKQCHKCKICDKRYLTIGSLTEHKRRQHPDNNGPHKCDICLRSFYKLHHLTSHKLMHSEPQHSCPVCPAKFRNKNTLNVHMRIHTNDTKVKPFACGICSSKFSHPSSYKRHIKEFHSNTIVASGNINTLEEAISELIKDNPLKHYCPETSEYKSIMCIDLPEENQQQQLPSTSKTQLENTKCSTFPQNIVIENSKAISIALPMKTILKDASNSSTLTTESNLELKTDKTKLSSIYNIEDFI